MLGIVAMVALFHPNTTVAVAAAVLAALFATYWLLHRRKLVEEGEAVPTGSEEPVSP